MVYRQDATGVADLGPIVEHQQTALPEFQDATKARNNIMSEIAKGIPKAVKADNAIRPATSAPKASNAASRLQVRIAEEDADKPASHNVAKYLVTSAPTLNAIALSGWIGEAVETEQSDQGAAILAIADRIAEHVELARTNDLRDLESALVAQVMSLQATYTTLSRLASKNVNNVKVCDQYLRLALKAQSQCRCTIEALAEIKNPRPVAFVKQANIAAGHQQVNNGETSPAREKQRRRSPSKLLKA